MVPPTIHHLLHAPFSCPSEVGCRVGVLSQHVIMVRAGLWWQQDASVASSWEGNFFLVVFFTHCWCRQGGQCLFGCRVFYEINFLNRVDAVFCAVFTNFTNKKTTLGRSLLLGFFWAFVCKVPRISTDEALPSWTCVPTCIPIWESTLSLLSQVTVVCFMSLFSTVLAVSFKFLPHFLFVSSICFGIALTILKILFVPTHCICTIISMTLFVSFTPCFSKSVLQIPFPIVS